MRILPFAVIMFAAGTAAAQSWASVDSAMGRTSAAQTNDVHRYAFPRGDMHVAVAGVEVRPALALGGWVAMKQDGAGARMMGDLVLADSEVERVTARLQAGGIAQTAIHHHLLHETPRVVYVHVHAHGDAVAIARGIAAAMSLTAAPAPGAPATSVQSSAPLMIDTDSIAAILGARGSVNGGVYQTGIPRAEVVRDGDFIVPPNMGLATALNFQPTAPGRAAITGDFVLTTTEVEPVMRALRDHGIQVTALHNHLVGEEPRLYFVHFWANDDALLLARGLRAALDLTNSRR